MYIKHLYSNKYCGIPLTLMLIQILSGGIMQWSGNWYGLIPFLIGFMMLTGFETVSSGSPKKVGILTFLGERTDEKVEGLVFLFKPFGFGVVDVIRIDTQQQDTELQVDEITCSDRLPVKGKVTITFIPDTTSAETLKAFDNAGQTAGVKSKLQEVVIVALQSIAEGRNPNGVPRDSVYMAKESRAVSEALQKILKAVGDGKDTYSGDDVRGFGIEIEKCQVKIEPNKSTSEAEEKSRVAVVMTKRIDERIEHKKTTGAIKEGADMEKEYDKARKELLDEDMQSQGLITENRGGNTINVNEIDKRGKNKSGGGK